MGETVWALTEETLYSNLSLLV